MTDQLSVVIDAWLKRHAPHCARCGAPFDHGCNSAYCSQACEDADAVDNPPCECCGEEGCECRIVTRGYAVDLLTDDRGSVMGEAGAAWCETCREWCE